LSGKLRPLVLSFVLLAGWNEAGHSTIARIAYDRLPARTRERVDALLAKHPAFESWPAGDPRAAFARAASWPDEIRKDDHPFHADHRGEDHFINLPHAVPESHLLTEEQSLAAVIARPNIVRRLQEGVATLKNRTVEESVRARELSWLIHLVGDIHQPLHCAALISSRFPQGDRGGNWALAAPSAVEIRPSRSDEPPRLPNLHALWDDLLTGASDIPAVEPGADPTFVPERWAWESFRLAVRAAYPEGLQILPAPEAAAALRDGRTVTIPALPAGYVEKAREVARRRAALAGARLAAVLVDVFGS